MVERFVLNQVAEVAPIVRGPNALARLSRFDLDWRIADARDKEALRQSLKGCESVVHAAVGDSRVIAETAAALIPAAVLAGVKRVVYLSTASVHGLAPAIGTDESSPLGSNQEFEYNNAKVRAERVLFKAARASDIELVVLRPSVVYGPRDRWVGPIVNELVRGTAWLIDGGTGICNSIYVDNLIGAIQAGLSAPAESMGRAYLVSDDEEVSWRRFYERVGELTLPKPSVLHSPQIPWFPGRGWRDRWGDLHAMPLTQRVISKVPSRWKRVIKGIVQSWPEPAGRSPWQRKEMQPELVLDRERICLQQCAWKLPCANAKQMLGYRPEVPFDDGMARTIDWMRWAGQIGGIGH